MLVKYTVSEFLSAKGSFSSIDNEPITTITEHMSQISNLIPSDRRRLNRVLAFAQNNKGPADHSKVQIAEGKVQTKKLVCRVAFQ